MPQDILLSCDNFLQDVSEHKKGPHQDDIFDVRYLLMFRFIEEVETCLVCMQGNKWTNNHNFSYFPLRCLQIATTATEVEGIGNPDWDIPINSSPKIRFIPQYNNSNLLQIKPLEQQSQAQCACSQLVLNVPSPLMTLKGPRSFLFLNPTGNVSRLHYFLWFCRQLSKCCAACRHQWTLLIQGLITQPHSNLLNCSFIFM